MDDFRTLFPFGLGLARHRALHVLGQIDVFHLDRRHLDAPGLRVLIEDLLQLLIQPIALRQQVVERRLA